MTSTDGGRSLAEALGYPRMVVETVPHECIERFDGVGNPFAAAPIPAGSHVVVVGSGAGFDAFVAARLIGAAGEVVGVEDDGGLVSLARSVAEHGSGNIDVREGSLTDLPIASGWADVAVANGAITRAARAAALPELHRVLRPAGALQMVAVASDAETDGWCRAIADAGFRTLAVGPAVRSRRGPSRTFRARTG